MSVLTPVIDYIDGETRRIFLREGVSDFYPIEDIYHEYRYMRKTNEELRKWEPFLLAEGNVSKGGGAYTPRYVVLLEGTKIIPFDEPLQVNQLGDMITDDADTDPILYDVQYITVGKTIFIKPSESETIQLNSESIVFSSFQGAVWVDVTSSYDTNGTSTVPNGNTERPVNNIPLAVEIAKERGFRTIQVIGDLTLGLGDDVRGMEIIGTSHVNSHLIVLDEALCLETSFRSFDVEGTLDGYSEINDCIIGDLTYFNGHIHDSALRGKITLGGTKDAKITNCSMLDIQTVPELDCGDTGQNIVMTNYSGRLLISNLTQNAQIGLGCDAGDIVIDETCIDGVIAISGTGDVVDNSQENCYVVDKIINGTKIANLQRMIELLRPHHTGTGNIWFWDSVNGNDLYHHGDHPDRAFKTFARAHEMAEDNNHDVIVIVPGDESGNTVITEAINITKNYIFLRGPGRDILFDHSDEPISINVTGNGVELSGFKVHNTTTDAVAVKSTGEFTMIDNIWVENCANGLFMTKAHPSIHNVKIYGATGYGIKIQGEVHHGEIFDCAIGDCGTNALEIDTYAGFGGIKMRGTTIVSSQGYGVSLSATTTKFISESGNIVRFNTLGNYDDLGTDNVTTETIQADIDPQDIWEYGSRTLTQDVSVDLSTIPADVWTYVQRELTVAAGLTAEQETTLNQILIDIQNIEAGSAGNEWKVTI